LPDHIHFAWTSSQDAFMNMPEELRPAVVVTGASTGIGREIAKVAAREGGPVVLVARSAEALAETAAEVRAAGGEPFVLALDLAPAGAPAKVGEFLAEQGLHCAVLVNNAGYGLFGAAATLPREDQLGIIDVNVRALTELTLRLLPGMLARRTGGILNVGSVAGFVPGPYMALYHASKAFVGSLSEALSEEVRGTGVTVTCVAPGPVRTMFFAKAGARRAQLFKILPKLTAEAVAESAWRGFRRGRRMVVPGTIASLTAFGAAYLPHAVSLGTLMRLQRGRGG
jgi:short-subunit dehydrogenase